MSAWHVARRILAIDFVITGLLAASNAIATVGIVWSPVRVFAHDGESFSAIEQL
jgi:hypothetical protein